MNTNPAYLETQLRALTLNSSDMFLERFCLGGGRKNE